MKSGEMLETRLEKIREKLQERVHSKQEIAELGRGGFSWLFPGAAISVQLMDASHSVSMEFIDNGARSLTKVERDYLVQRARDLLGKKNIENRDYIYVGDRLNFAYSDRPQITKDQVSYGYPCADALYVVLISEDDSVLGAVFIQNWAHKKRLDEEGRFAERLQNARELSAHLVSALDNAAIHEKIESLLTDKRELKQRIQKDEEDLKRRVLELTVLYDMSNTLSYSLDHRQIVNFVLDSLYKVLHFDVSAIFLTDFVPDGEIILRLNRAIKSGTIKKIQTDIVSAIKPFAKRDFNPEAVKSRVESNYSDFSAPPLAEPMHSYANVPLIFREEVIGMLNICSAAKNMFSRNEMTFLHTMANQLASHLGRLKIIKTMEKSKINSLIKSMAEGIVMLDSRNNVEIINPAAEAMLHLRKTDTTYGATILRKLKELDLSDLYKAAAKSKRRKTVFNKQVFYKDRVLSANVAPVIDVEQHRVGTVLVFRDETEIQKINRINAQRLSIISRLDVVIKSITDLDTLLDVLIDFILGVANAEMGSIQLKEGKSLNTRVHSNFPDKIRRECKFLSGESLSEQAAKSKEICFVENYTHEPRVNQAVKVHIDWYLCIPIMVKNELIGLVNMARKQGSHHPKLTTEDIHTLTTITSLAGTSIQNAIFYQETLKKQKLEQELKVAYDIQTKLLPGKTPFLSQGQFAKLSIPAREIGGDYFDFFEYENGQIGIAIADIVGKGVPAGLFMAMLKSILHTHIFLFDSPSSALSRINSILYKDPVVNKFIPLFFAILDPVAMELKYCNAGHEPALLFSQRRFHSLDTQGFPLGALEDAKYEEKSLKLKPGDFLLFFTDGLIDAKNGQGRAFGLERLKKLVSRHASEDDAQNAVDNIYSAVKDYSQNRGLNDDVTIVALRSDKRARQNQAPAPLKIKEIRTSSAKQNVKLVRREVERLASEMGFSSSDIFNIKLAINEAQANVIDHAYQGDEKGQILFRFEAYADRLQIFIRDFGSGLGQKSVKGEEKFLEELEGSGLGVLLIQSVMDKVEYKRTSKVGTELVLTKFLKPGLKGKKKGKINRSPQ